MSVLALYHNLKARDVTLEADGENLKVSAPAGVLTEEDREKLRKFKPVLLRLSRAGERVQETENDGRRFGFDARRSKYPGYTSIYDPIEGEWHDFPTKDCYPSIVDLASKRRSKGGES